FKRKRRTIGGRRRGLIMDLQFSVLASGSTGNAFYLASDDTELLVDAGLSGKKLDGLFHSIGKDPRNLSGILVTHEHNDIIKKLGIFEKNYNLQNYENEKSFSNMDKQIDKLTVVECVHLEENTEKTFGNIDIESFSVSYDAVDPMFFNFHADNKKVSL